MKSTTNPLSQESQCQITCKNVICTQTTNIETESQSENCRRKNLKKMAAARLGDSIGIKEEIIKKALSVAMKAPHNHKSPEKLYNVEKSRNAIFNFPGSWSENDWYAQGPFGETKINLDLFPSLRSVGKNEVAKVNEAFLRRFQAILARSLLKNEVAKVVTDKKRVVFTGHSAGGAIAILATIWFLENIWRRETQRMPPFCVTFGSPLVGDCIFNHALARENWACYFAHFVSRYDIVPRILLAPLSSVQGGLQQILRCFQAKSTVFVHKEATDFYRTVMRSAESVASSAASILMGSTNMLLNTVLNFVELSPYWPFGTYIFCTGNGKMVVERNPDAVLQLLIYSSQLGSEADCEMIASRSLHDHLAYENELQESLEMQDVVYLDDLEKIPLASNGVYGETQRINKAMDDLGLSTRGRLCLKAAGEMEKQKLKNEAKIIANKSEIENFLSELETYQGLCNVGYYDAFKIQKDVTDFKANVKRLELAGKWDEITEMLKRNELPDQFEGRKEWIELGTKYRRMVEPLDIGNFYRHLKNEDTGPYMDKARPSRYRFIQRWREHDLKMPPESCWESCLWAHVEELSNKTCYKNLSVDSTEFQDIKEQVVRLETAVQKWIVGEELGTDVFLAESTFAKWWKTLPQQHRSVSCIASFMNR